MLWAPSEQQQGEPRYIPDDNEIWELIDNRLEQYCECLERFSYLDNLPYINLVAKFHADQAGQFPDTGPGGFAKLQLLRYLSFTSVLANQFSDAMNHLTAYKAAIVKKMQLDQRKKKKVDPATPGNMRHFALMLLMKARVRTLQCDFDAATKPLFKLDRLLARHFLTNEAQESVQLAYY